MTKKYSRKCSVCQNPAQCSLVFDMGAVKEAISSGSVTRRVAVFGSYLSARSQEWGDSGPIENTRERKKVTIQDLATAARKRKVENGLHKSVSKSSTDVLQQKRPPSVSQKRRSTIDNPLDRRALSRLSKVTEPQSSRVSSACTIQSLQNKALFNELGRIDRLARQRRNAVHYEKQVYIPKFNSGGPDNLMQQMEMNSWARQMKAMYPLISCT